MLYGTIRDALQRGIEQGIDPGLILAKDFGRLGDAIDREEFAAIGGDFMFRLVAFASVVSMPGWWKAFTERTPI